MKYRRRAVLGVFALTLSVSLTACPLPGQTPQGRVVRLAELEIDPARLQQYKTALRQEIDASIRVEPGVLTLYAVSVKKHPEQVRLFEMYANPDSYQAHLRSPHFLKYKKETAGMVKSLTLLETDPILLGSKFK